MSLQEKREKLGTFDGFKEQWWKFFRKGQVAFLVIDAQNDCVRQEGNMHDLMIWKYAKDAVSNIKRLEGACRKVDVPIFWVRQGRLAGGRDVFSDTYDGAWLDVTRKVTSDYMMPDTWHYEIIDELKELIRDRDIVIDKRGWSAFEGTRLQIYLVQLGIRSLIVCGFSTAHCVEGTCRSGIDRGYNTVLVGDASATNSAELQASTLGRISAGICPIATTDEAVRMLESWSK